MLHLIAGWFRITFHGCTYLYICWPLFTVRNITAVAPTIQLPTSYNMFHTCKPCLTLLVGPLYIPNIEVLTESIEEIIFFVYLHSHTQYDLDCQTQTSSFESFWRGFNPQLFGSPALKRLQRSTCISQIGNFPNFAADFRGENTGPLFSTDPWFSNSLQDSISPKFWGDGKGGPEVRLGPKIQNGWGSWTLALNSSVETMTKPEATINWQSIWSFFGFVILLMFFFDNRLRWDWGRAGCRFVLETKGWEICDQIKRFPGFGFDSTPNFDAQIGEDVSRFVRCVASAFGLFMVLGRDVFQVNQLNRCILEFFSPLLPGLISAFIAVEAFGWWRWWDQSLKMIL